MKLPQYLLGSLMLLAVGCTLPAEGLLKGGQVVERRERTANGHVISAIVAIDNFCSDKFIFSEPQLWGANSSGPHVIISNLEIFYDKDKVLIPYAKYTDLSDIRDVNLESVNEGFSISIKGGTGAATFEAILSFDSFKLLLGRKVYRPDRQGVIMEESENSYIRREDM